MTITSIDHILTVYERIQALRKYSRAQEIEQTAEVTGVPVEEVRRIVQEHAGCAGGK